MGTIPANTLTTLLDSLAAGKLIFDNAVGVLGTEVNTTAKASQNDLTTLSAVADAAVQSDLAAAFKTRADLLTAPTLYATLGAYNLWWVLDKHTGNSGQAGVANLDTFLQVNNVRVSSHVLDMGFPLSPEQIMPPAVNPMATFAVTGAAAGTYAHVADIDTTQYGRAWLDVVVTATVGASPITATVNGLQFDNVTVTNKQVTISANSSIGTTVHVGTLGTQADSYDYVTGITITGGTAGDAFKVVSRVERTISPVS